ncbi:ABC transporter ATP-binding protein [Pirellulales bacterium]|nr:ABC transporter ATP-binding protein [Pirellulales bacterium]MDB4475268.1 ABC transporter ATP-binding protein [Pirellulales bacterium]
MSKTLLDVADLTTVFENSNQKVTAVNHVSISVGRGKTLGVVGESGSGKSVTAMSILRLVSASGKIESGSITLSIDDTSMDLLKISEPKLRKIRGGRIAMIFQEPMTSLNPVYTVGYQVMEAILLHQKIGKEEARRKTIELFHEVGIPNPSERIHMYPHEMSGGQRQRVMIAMALSCSPDLLIADEPTTALDVTIQAQILNLLRALCVNRNMGMIFITHDLGVIAEIADDVAVMYRGKVVEHSDVLSIFSKCKHPYTRSLLLCRPTLNGNMRRLPTVSDFMETELQNDGSEKIFEKDISEAGLRNVEENGRGRHLYPIKRLAELGYSQSSEKRDEGITYADEAESPLVRVKELKVHFPIRRGIFSRISQYVEAVDGVTFDVYRGQTLGLVGESGCGKTTIGRCLMRLINPTSGTVMFGGVDISTMSQAKLRPYRKRFQIIFQDPYGSLNPRKTIEEIITEPMRFHGIGVSRKDWQERALGLLEKVGLPGMQFLKRYPHEFSGGQRQRVCIARALAVNPELIICDEAVSALDVSVQAQVLNLLKDLQAELGLTYIFISHDLSVVKFMSDMMAVMKSGKFVEFGPSERIYENPKKEYTKALIRSIPNVNIKDIEMRQKTQDRSSLCS